MSYAPRLAVTVGDPAGIGPLVAERAIRQWRESDRTMAVRIFAPENLADRFADLPNVTLDTFGAFEGAVGEPSRASGEAALHALLGAIRAAQKGEVDGIVTAPISKQAIALAGEEARGHTEILARHLSRGPVAMAFYTEALRVALVTTHLPLAAAIAGLSSVRVVEVIRLFHQSLRADLGVEKPRIALAGLNPHAGEGGLMGTEEIRVLQPAVELARRDGVDVTGPFPADTIFRRAHDGEFDGVVALYHDQGLIPAKLLGNGQAVNVTLGLGVVRTSPDHGTAYDKAVAADNVTHSGMLSALDLAGALCAARQRSKP